jgi:hypothetical protein
MRVTNLLLGLFVLTSVSASAAELERPSPGGITVIADLVGWWHAGTNMTAYSIDVDRTVSHGGKVSARIKCVVPEPTGFGSLMQVTRPDRFLGKRIRMSAWVKTENLKRYSGLWMRVDGPTHDPTKSLTIDTMDNRPIVGTRDWQKYEIVLDVAAEAGDIAFGAHMSGPGTLWVDDFAFEEVPKTVPVTSSKAPPPLAPEPQTSISNAERVPTATDASLSRRTICRHRRQWCAVVRSD